MRVHPEPDPGRPPVLICDRWKKERRKEAKKSKPDPGGSRARGRTK